MRKQLQETIVHTPEIKLLVVDDRPDNLFSIETILQREHYQIRTARSGREALKILLKEQDFTLILMDVQMPDLNGFETAALIYESDRLKQIPIIFVTAHDHGEESVFKGYQLGGVDYIYKPINPELLRAKVAVFVELYKKNIALITQEQKLIVANKNLENEIEERKASEKKISVLNKQLMEHILQLKITNQELERYAFVASHDLQEPLRKIILFGTRLKDKYGKEFNAEISDLLDRMIKSSNRMKMLIKNLLDFSTATNNTEHYVDTDINEVVAAVVSDLELLIQQKNATIAYTALPVLKGLPEQFRQLFQNLISNALKFTRPGIDPLVTIEADKMKGMYLARVSYDQYEETFYRITVKDNGMGFEEQYAEQIFSIFKRLHSFDQVEGTGIGLSICKRIVEKYKGYIYASGTPGEGAVFTIILPVNAANLIRPNAVS